MLSDMKRKPIPEDRRAMADAVRGCMLPSNDKKLNERLFSVVKMLMGDAIEARKNPRDGGLKGGDAE